MSQYQHLHLVAELYNAMLGYYAAAQLSTTDTGFQLDFLDNAQQRVCTFNYDAQQPTTIELTEKASADLQTQLENLAEKWNATLQMFSPAS